MHADKDADTDGNICKWGRDILVGDTNLSVPSLSPTINLGLDAQEHTTTDKSYSSFQVQHHTSTSTSIYANANTTCNTNSDYTSLHTIG